MLLRGMWSSKAFEYSTWGREIRKEFEPQAGDTVILEHGSSSGFANTDLDLQLKKHGIHQLIVIGLIAQTCVEAKVRYAFELCYEVTMVRDATADYSEVEMHAAALPQKSFHSHRALARWKDTDIVEKPF